MKAARFFETSENIYPKTQRNISEYTEYQKKFVSIMNTVLKPFFGD
jgi:hypothetical protein